MKYVILLLICLSKTICVAQGLSIELSIHWKNEDNYYKLYSPNKKQIKVPYLVITYINHTDENIYFKKSTDFSLFPSFIFASTGLLHILRSLDSRIETFSFSRNTDQKFDIYMGSQYFLDGWEVVEDTVDRHKERTTSLINDELEVINSIMKIQTFLDKNFPDKQLGFFDYPEKETIKYSYARCLKNFSESDKVWKLEFYKRDLLPENIINSEDIKNKFCFLKKGESFVQKINLISLLFLGGNYTFSLENKVLYDYVLGDFNSGDKRDNKNEYTKLKLPEHVGVYKLYTGKFKTNAVIVKCVD